MPAQITPHNLSKMLAHYRYMEQLTVKALADDIGVTPSVLSGVLDGRIPDGLTHSKLLSWMFKGATK